MAATRKKCPSGTLGNGTTQAGEALRPRHRLHGLVNSFDRSLLCCYRGGSGFPLHCPAPWAYWRPAIAREWKNVGSVVVACAGMILIQPHQTQGEPVEAHSWGKGLLKVVRP